MPDNVVHTVKLGRLINICGHFNGHKKNCVNFLQGTCPEKKILSTKIHERKCQYTGINLSKISAPLFFLDTKLITFVRTEIKKGRPLI